MKREKSTQRRRKLLRLPLKMVRGFTLLEMGLAVAIASAVLAYTAAIIAQGLRLQEEAGRLATAIMLAQTKISQLRNDPDLKPLDESGQFEEEGLYQGYGWEIEVREEKFDLAKVYGDQEEDAGLAIDDLLPEEARNEGDEEQVSLSDRAATFGEIEVMRINVVITYPKGSGERGTYRVETFQAATF